MNILFQGYYGHKNTGDDAFVEVAAWGAKKYWHSNSQSFIANEIPQVLTKSNLTGKTYFKGHKQLKIVNSILLSNAFVVAGGSNFHSTYNYLNPKIIATLKKSVFKNYKVGAIGVSLGPYKSNEAEKQNIDLLKKFDFLALRDKPSYQKALSYNLPYEPVEAFDLAALLPNIYSEFNIQPNKRHKTLGVSICNYESYIPNGNIKNEERRNKKIEELVMEIIKQEKEIRLRFFIFNGHERLGDKKITFNLIEKIKALNFNNYEVINYSSKTHYTWVKIQECSLMISTRLHAAIFACFANVPFFLVEYHKKCTDFLNTIEFNDIRLYDAQFDTKKVAFRILNLVDNQGEFKVPLSLEKAKILAEKNFTETLCNF